MNGGNAGGRSHSRSQQHSQHPAGGKAAMTFTTNSSILGTTTTTIIPNGKHGDAGSSGAHTPSSGHSGVEASASAAGHVHSHVHGHGHGGPPSVLDSKQHKKCSVCGKSFNPLRRRHYCRTCTAVVCSSCSISRKVESTFEGAITVRMCVTCKLSAIASQDDFYDRIFSSNSNGPASGGLGAPPSDGFGGSDRLSVASYASNSNASTAGPLPAVDSTPPMDKRSASASSLGNNNNNAPVPQPPLRRKSSAVSANNANNRRDSLGSSNAGPAGDDESSYSSHHQGGGGGGGLCPLCHNEACAPIREYADVPYPFFLELADPNAGGKSPQFVAAKPLDNEKDRLRSVRTLRNALKLGAVPGSQTTMNQLCSMAAIATSSPLALVGLLDKHVYAPVAETGIGNLDKIDRHKSLAAHTCRNGGPLVCSELARDVRFAANPWAREAIRAGFYAGIPLTLSNGHVVGAVEVFDVKPRYACMDVVAQLQAVVRGLQRKLDEILTKAPTVDDEYLAGRSPVKPVVTPTHSSTRRTDSVDSGGSGHSSHHSSHSHSHHGKRSGSRPPPPNAPAAPPIPPPKKAPSPPPVQEPQPRAPPPQAAPPAPPSKPVAESPAPAKEQPQQQPQQQQQQQEAQPNDNEMERRLLELLSQTTNTQEQLRNQQSSMVHAISSHSKQIGELAKQLQRMETTLASKLGVDKDDEEEVEAEVPPATAAA